MIDITFEEALKNSLTPFYTEEIKLEDGTIQKGYKTLPIGFTEFLLSMSLLIIHISVSSLNIKVSDDIYKIIQTLYGNDILTHTQVFLGIQEFTRWLIEQEAITIFDDESGEDAWDSASGIIKMWNQFITKEDEK